MGSHVWKACYTGSQKTSASYQLISKEELEEDDIKTF